MNGEALVQLAMATLACNQKTLASHLGVSPAQISKWKKGDHMSFDMSRRLRDISGIGDRVPGFVQRVGSLDEAKKWERLLAWLAELAEDAAETGYDTPLSDEPDILSWDTLDVLEAMGVAIPQPFPPELEVDYDDDEVSEEVLQHELVSLIYAIYKSLTGVYGFYAAYVQDLVFDDELDLFAGEGGAIDFHLLALAASKVEAAERLAPGFKRFQYRIEKNYIQWLNVVKAKAVQAGKPLRAELLNMVHGSHDELGHEAEAESFGMNARRLHPDIYMDELLRGMRVIHQVLPAILKKLEIYDEFALDESELRAGG